MLLPGEKIEADLGYCGDLCKNWHSKNFVSYADQRAKWRARWRHETVNECFKKYNVLYQKFRHDIWKHKMLFKADATIVKWKLHNCGNCFKYHLVFVNVMTKLLIQHTKFFETVINSFIYLSRSSFGSSISVRNKHSGMSGFG